MAKYYGLGQEGDIPRSEKIVADALRKLPEPWVIFHNVSWQSFRDGRQGDGEADFVLFHPAKGILVVEVKGGGIEIVDGNWFTYDRYELRHKIKNPYEQAKVSKYTLLRRFQLEGLNIAFGHCVIFPDLSDLSYLGLAAPSEITIGRTYLDSIESSLNRCCVHWGMHTNSDFDQGRKILRLLAPTTSAKPKLVVQIAESEGKIIQLTEEQIKVYANIKARRGGLILGGAGTGKTVLAVARARQLAQDGFRTLLICYNELLGQDLAQRVGDDANVVATTYHKMCILEAGRAGLKLPNSIDHIWWENKAAEVLLEACGINQSLYDAIVVDEGQDFSPEWIKSLRCLGGSSADVPLFVFADPYQDLWKRDYNSDEDYGYQDLLTVNLRNTLPIAKKVSNTIGLDCQSRGVAGSKPVWRVSPSEKQQESTVLEITESLLEEGFKYRDILILCSSSRLAASLRERTIGTYSFSVWGANGIPVETVARFKGLESKVVVLVLNNMADASHVYVGMSRARSHLVVIGSGQQCKLFKWDRSLN